MGWVEWIGEGKGGAGVGGGLGGGGVGGGVQFAICCLIMLQTKNQSLAPNRKTWNYVSDCAEGSTAVACVVRCAQYLDVISSA